MEAKRVCIMFLLCVQNSVCQWLWTCASYSNMLNKQRWEIFLSLFLNLCESQKELELGSYHTLFLSGSSEVKYAFTNCQLIFCKKSINKSVPNCSKIRPGKKKNMMAKAVRVRIWVAVSSSWCEFCVTISVAWIMCSVLLLEGPTRGSPKALPQFMQKSFSEGETEE